jgi:alpha-ribazole phosphatase/probable phosphoglycerate mutase
MTRLLLIRHARPQDDARGRCYGRLDVDLGPEGRREAEEFARSLASVDLAAVYSSPRRRALQTAAPLAGLHGLAPIPDDRLAELDFGDLEGRTYDEIAATQPELYRAWMETPTAVEFPNGESYASLRRRALEAVASIRAATPAGTAALVTHGGIVRAILADCLGMPDPAIFRLRQDYCGVSVVEWIEDVPLVELVNARVGDGAPALPMRD